MKEAEQTNIKLKQEAIENIRKIAKLENQNTSLQAMNSQSTTSQEFVEMINQKDNKIEELLLEINV